MDYTNEKRLLTYLKALVFDIKIENSLPEEFLHDEEIVKIDEILRTLRGSIRAIGNGDLSYKIQGSGYILGVLKNLQASLKNLTWQTKAIASGDFSQRVDFLGEFSTAFNRMVEKLNISIHELNEAKELFEMVFETIPDATLITSLSEGSIFAYNKAFCALTGYEKDTLYEKNIAQVKFYKDLAQQSNLYSEIEKFGYCQNMLIDLNNVNDELIRGLFSSQVIVIHGKKHILSVIKDVTQLNKIENQLRESEERHRLLADNVSDVIWTMDLNGAFSYISPSVEKLRGYTVEEVMNQSQEEILCPASLVYMQEGLIEAINSVQNNLPFRIFRGDLEQPCKDGTTVWTDTTVSGIYDKENKFIGMVGVSRDISDRKKMEEEIRQLSVTDKLTQLYNRLKLDESLNIEIERFRRSHVVVSVIIVDIDFFKKVNDQHGHQVGDSVLIEFARILEGHIRKVDILGRWGGEEFMIILPATGEEGALTIAEKLRKEIFAYNFGIAGHLTASFGLAEASLDITASEIVSKADQALYQAKKLGRNRVVKSTDT
jgi:diguanylate cyclase (GGDEF)-like protein/PAS domain S-box-containing protein